MSKMSPKEIVTSFWQAMNTNDFVHASQWLSPGFRGIWPQSSEVICGRENFAALNTHYPTEGSWSFHINSIMCDEDIVVTDVSITDGIQNARAISFHTVSDGLISKQVEYWPEDYSAPSWRSQWVELF